MKKFLYISSLVIVAVVGGAIINWSSRIYTCTPDYPVENRPAIKNIRSQCQVWSIVDSLFGHPDRKYNIFY